MAGLAVVLGLAAPARADDDEDEERLEQRVSDLETSLATTRVKLTEAKAELSAARREQRMVEREVQHYEQERERLKEEVDAISADLGALAVQTLQASDQMKHRIRPLVRHLEDRGAAVKARLEEIAPSDDSEDPGLLGHAQDQLNKIERRVSDLEDQVQDRTAAESELELQLELARDRYATVAAAGPGDSCGGRGTGTFCLVGGLFTATGSAAAVSGRDGFDGQTTQQIVSLAIPFVGARYAFSGVALDLGLFTSVFGQEVSFNERLPSASACRKDAVPFEEKLPCEGDARLRPYGALFLGPSFGSEDITYISFHGVLGFARTEKDPTPGLFFGAMFGFLGIQKTLRFQ